MLRYFFSPLFWAGTILFLSSIPSDEIPHFDLWDLLSFDKLVHISMYGIFSFQIMKSCIRQYANWLLRYNAAKIAVITSSLYGVIIEILQEFVMTDRHFDWLDIVANVIGAFTGIYLFRKIFRQYV
jgi:VanZ family protein